MPHIRVCVRHRPTAQLNWCGAPPPSLRNSATPWRANAAAVCATIMCTGGSEDCTTAPGRHMHAHELGSTECNNAAHYCDELHAGGRGGDMREMLWA